MSESAKQSRREARRQERMSRNEQTRKDRIARGKKLLADPNHLKRTRYWRKNRMFLEQDAREGGAVSSFLVRTNRRVAAYFFVFIGEWGYEILASHGWLRRLKMENPKVTIGVASRAGAEFLYEDACDVYVDITDILAKHRSSMFGINLLKEDYAEIESRCCKALPGHLFGMVYSNNYWANRGIEYGPRSKYHQGHQVRNPYYLNLQVWKSYELKNLATERKEIEDAFPDLLNSDYILVQDRRRMSGWGRESYSIQTWHTILNHLVDTGYKPVLVGYEPWKYKDSTSIFTNETFADVPGTVNISKFLSKHIKRNLAYQAVFVKHCRFWLGVWGSASMLPPLMGKTSYVLSAARGSVARQERDRRAWKSTFSLCGGEIKYLNTDLDSGSAVDALRRARVINGKPSTQHDKKPEVSVRIVKKNRVAIVTLSWNRLYYTKHCWTTLHEKAGMPFDHFVIDNGSTDGTVDWIKENESMFRGIIYNSVNLGIAVARTQSLQFLDPYDWFIMAPNDVEVLTDDFVVKMAEFWELTHGQYLFAPRLYGIKHVIKVLDTYKIGDFKVEEVGPTGGCFMAVPTKLFRDYINNMQRWRVNELCRIANKRGMKNLYLPDLKANHYETTEGQFKRYPDMKVGYNREIGPVPPASYESFVAEQPFMTFVTRCYKRPRALERCKASIQAQTDQDFEHIFIIDNKGRGIKWANEQFYKHRNRVRGKYVYLVDDDAYMTDPGFVSAIRAAAESTNPDAIMVKMNIGPREYPNPDVWGKYPIRGRISGGCICVKNEIYQEYIEFFGQPKAGDFHFIKAIFDAGSKIVWLDRNVKQTKRSRGRPEAN